MTDITKILENAVSVYSPQEDMDWRIAFAVLDSLYRANIINYEEYNKVYKWCEEIYPKEQTK